MDGYKRSLKYLLYQEMTGINIKQQVILVIIETVCVCMPGIILVRKGKLSIKKVLHIYILVLYAGIIFSFTILRRTLGSRSRSVLLRINLGFTLTGIKSLWVSGLSMLNILLFIPWGMIVCSFIRKEKSYERTLLSTMIGFSTSACIECTQFVTRTGMFELTDLITNTLGSFVGAVIMECCLYCYNNSKKKH